MLSLQGLDALPSQYVADYLSGLQSSYNVPFSGLHTFAVVGSAISYGLMQTVSAPSNDMLSVFFGYRQGVFATAPARAIPPGFDHTLMDWFLACASITYDTANSFDAASFPLHFLIMPLRQSFAAFSAQKMLPPVLVIARPAFYPQSVSNEIDHDNFVGVFGVEVDIPTFASFFNENEICRLESSDCILANDQGWIIMDKQLMDPLTAMSAIEKQHVAESASQVNSFQRPLQLHISRQYRALTEELVARGLARSSSDIRQLRGGLLMETADFRIHLPALPAAFEVYPESLTVSLSLVPWSNAVFFVLRSSSRVVAGAASGIGCGLSLHRPVDILHGEIASVPRVDLRSTFARNAHPLDLAAMVLPWATQWSAGTAHPRYASQESVTDAAPYNFIETFIEDNADFFEGSSDLFTMHQCDTFDVPLSTIFASLFAVVGLLVLTILIFKHFQAVNRLFNVSVQMSLAPRNLPYLLCVFYPVASCCYSFPYVLSDTRCQKLKQRNDLFQASQYLILSCTCAHLQQNMLSLTLLLVQPTESLQLMWPVCLIGSEKGDFGRHLR
jgi:hypothetical protein